MTPARRTTALWQALRLALGTASALGLARFAYGLLVPAMRDDLHWSLAEAGVMSAANGLGYLLGALVTPVVQRRLGTAGAFRWGMVLTALALGATAAGGDHLALLIARAVAGAAGALVFIAGGVIAARIATEISSGLPITVYFAGTGLGIVVSSATIPALGARWQLAWLGLSAAAALATLVSWSAADTCEGKEAKAATAGRAQIRPVWRTALAYLLFAAGYITYITYLSAYLADRHVPVAQVTLTWAVLGLAVVAAPWLWSRPITLWPGDRTLAALLAVLAGGAALALASSALPVILASAAVYGATFMAVPAAVTALIKNGTSPADWTATLAAFTTLFAAGQTAGPWIAGILADHTSADAALAWTAALCALAAAIAATSGRAAPFPGPVTRERERQ
ncbi:putative MFS family arabinose efflux permease [Nonomuraea polychroma]|uniref:Putative MFS family arabinose efflux permease n=1 Tax=Nonomuraea polychroma TaxID=46176 RepID=A0A438LYP4_9ACTN|nr:YbfB/YjiJ family MFS transporter [Nonomuraea polychroma]RVX38646.1 putative MFS family arabinose efflux permease [Nonomuraea polychroma]